MNLALEHQIWSIEEVAEYLGYTVDYTRRHIITTPYFPPPRMLPTKSNRLIKKWKASDIVAYATAYDKSTVIYK